MEVEEEESGEVKEKAKENRKKGEGDLKASC